MRSKRGQVTIFIIIAILVIGAVALFFIVKEGLGKEAYSSEIAPVANFVEECLEDSLVDVVYRIGEGGGYYYPGSVLSTELLEVPYYIKEGESYMPSKEKIELEISKYVHRELVLCLGDFALFPEYEITKGKITPEAKIDADKVSVKMNYPLTIKKGETSQRIKDFETEIPVRLGIVYDSISDFIEREQEDEGFCVSCFLEIAVENDLYANVFDYDNETTIFIVRDFNSVVNDKEFVFNFANEY